MTPEQRGMLMSLMAEAWESDPPGSLPNDPDLLWRLAGAKTRKRFEAVSALILEKFEIHDERLFQPQLIEQSAAIKEVSQARRIAGLSGAAATWGNGNRMANAMANAINLPGYSEERKTKRKIQTQDLIPGSREWQREQQRTAALSDSLRTMSNAKKMPS